MPVLLWSDFSVIGKEKLCQIMTELHGCMPLSRRGRGYLLVMAVAVLLVVFGSLGANALAAGRPPLRSLISAIPNPTIFPVIVASFIPIYVARTQRLQRIEGVMLRHGRYPHCGYRIAHLPVDSHNQTVCPECADVWLLLVHSPSDSIHVVAEASRRRLVSIMLLATGLTALALVATLSLVLS